MTRAHILAEIKRTANANGGVSLGTRRFWAETGIKKSDWQKYWPRLSDAHRELGYSPNKLSEAYDEIELLDKLARLAQDLGRLPTDNDLRFKAHTDPNFPSVRPFSRLGSKPQVVAKLIRYCGAHAGFEHVVELCQKYKARDVDTVSESHAEGGELGSVYLIKSGRFYKIGRSNAAGRREYELAIQLPEETKTIHVVKTDDPAGIEEYWHKRFASKRKKGEWFALNVKDIAAFKRRRFM